MRHPPPPSAKKAPASNVVRASAKKPSAPASRDDLLASIVNVRKSEFFRKVEVLGLPESIVNQAVQLNNKESQEIVRQLNSIMNCDDADTRNSLFNKFEKLFSNEHSSDVNELITKIKTVIKEREIKLLAEGSATSQQAPKNDLASVLSFAISQRAASMNPDAGADTDTSDDDNWDSDDDSKNKTPVSVSSSSLSSGRK